MNEQLLIWILSARILRLSSAFFVSAQGI